MKRKTLSVLAVLILSLSVYGEESGKGSPSTSEQDLKVPLEKISEILKTLEEPYRDMKSISYNAERKRTTLKGKMEDSWSFIYRAPSDIRIEYRSPERRVVIINARDMWEYLPGQRVAMHTDLGNKSQSEKDAAVAKVLARIAVSGLRPGNYDHLLSQVTSSEMAGDILTIEGKKAPRFLLKIDTRKNALLVSEVYDANGKLKLKTTCSEHKRVDKSVWMPGKVVVVTRGNDQYVTDQVYVSEATFEHEFRDDQFVFSKPANVQMMENTGKKR